MGRLPLVIDVWQVIVNLLEPRVWQRAALASRETVGLLPALVQCVRVDWYSGVPAGNWISQSVFYERGSSLLQLRALSIYSYQRDQEIPKIQALIAKLPLLHTLECNFELLALSSTATDKDHATRSFPTVQVLKMHSSALGDTHLRIEPLELPKLRKIECSASDYTEYDVVGGFNIFNVAHLKLTFVFASCAPGVIKKLTQCTSTAALTTRLDQERETIAILCGVRMRFFQTVNLVFLTMILVYLRARAQLCNIATLTTIRVKFREYAKGVDRTLHDNPDLLRTLIERMDKVRQVSNLLVSSEQLKTMIGGASSSRIQVSGIRSFGLAFDSELLGDTDKLVDYTVT